MIDVSPAPHAQPARGVCCRLSNEECAMSTHFSRFALTMLFGLVVPIADQAFAAGEIVLTQAKAQNGGITPGDTPGFPITLSKQGTYRFGSNIFPTAGKDGIQITTSYVTIDLGGFLLHGGDAASRAIIGSGNALTVKNGTIAHFKFGGIIGAFSYWTVESLRIVENGEAGIFVGNFAKITDSTISANSGSGVQCDSDCHIEGNIVSSNIKEGIVIASGTVLGNTIQDNGLQGITTSGKAGYGNNTLLSNHGGGAQTSGTLLRLHPNACDPACP
jgi:parallel beta-helix repeat protein